MPELPELMSGRGLQQLHIGKSNAFEHVKSNGFLASGCEKKLLFSVIPLVPESWGHSNIHLLRHFLGSV